MQYSISAPERKCSACGKGITGGESLYSAIFERGESFERRDYCLDCWDDPPQECFSFWRTRIEEKDKEEKRKLDAEVVLGFFRELDKKTSDAELNFRYVIALLLMRKRILKFHDVVQLGSGESLVLRRPREDTLHRVLVRSLSEEEIRELTGEVARLLAAGTMSEDGGQRNDEQEGPG